MQINSVYNQPTFGASKGSKLVIVDNTTMYRAKDFGEHALSGEQKKALRSYARQIKTDNGVIDMLIGPVNREYDLNFNLFKRHQIRTSTVIGGDTITLALRNAAPDEGVLTNPFHILGEQLLKLKKISNVLNPRV